MTSDARYSPRWWLVWLVAITLVAAGWYGFERYWRTRGYTPSIMDSYDLWAQQRARITRSSPPLRVALIGASRIQYGISPAAFKDEALRHGIELDPSMLALSGQFPLSTLEDVSKDERFNGLAIVGIDGRGFHRAWRDMQQPYVDYFHREFTPAKDLHRRLLTPLQQRLIAARSDFAAATLTARFLDGHGAPHKEFITFNRDRSSGTDYVRSNTAAIRNHRIAELRENYPKFKAPTPEEWLAANLDIAEWVERINRRGGKVVFYREPVSDEHFEMDEIRFPRAKMWDVLATKIPATFVDFQDYPELQFPTPDTSHIDIRNVDPHTRAFVRLLVKKNVLAVK
ncbi:MAG: hypothetical protein ACRCWJ_02470 [Casimicrobium sp.]